MSLRVLRVIARMNIGGPAHHVGILTSELERYGYRTRLVTGVVPEHEGSLDDLVAGGDHDVVSLPALGPELDPARDLRALAALVREIRTFRPHVVHTHTAKAGALGRSAAALLGPRRPVVVHTYHGHVLRGYFGRRTSAAYTAVERGLGHVSDALLGVSGRTVEELVELGVAPRERFRVIPVGLRLQPFLEDRGDRAAARASFGYGDDDLVLGFIGRITTIKRVDVLLEAFELARDEVPALRLLLVGDGDDRPDAEARAAASRHRDDIAFAGFRRDLPEVVAALDVAVLSSDNEGTPVSLIEAAAGGLPLLSTDVGGVSDIVTPTTGLLAPPADPRALADKMIELARLEPAARNAIGAAARRHVRDRYDAERLVEDVASLYDELRAARAAASRA